LNVSDKVKAVVAHRDFNTRNILVRADLSCVLCDLGFAMKLAGTRLYRGQDEEQVSLIDVCIEIIRSWMILGWSSHGQGVWSGIVHVVPD
jgi:serine/threonine protein kinase